MDNQARLEQLITNLKILNPAKLTSADYLASYDTALLFALNKSIDDCLLYTNIDSIDDLPELLDRTIVSMASDLINANQLTTPITDRVNDNVQSISEGDTSVSFKTPAEIASIVDSSHSLAKDYRSKLNHYRRRRR